MNINSNLKVCIIGLGYIGLPTAALIASKQIHITGVDISKHVVDTINKGKIHIVEPDLDGLVKHVVEKGYLKAALTPTQSDVYMIAVPTPLKPSTEEKCPFYPDMSYVFSAVDNILPTLNNGCLIILESTSPVGSSEAVSERIYNKRPELKGNISIAYCPERVLPGRIIYELEHNDRVIGGIDEVSTEKATKFYSLFVKGNLHKTTSRTAEMCKLVENAFRDVNIAFANELSMICDSNGINVNELIALSNKHPRVNILQPGPGVGGHCIAVDPWFLVHEYPEIAKLIRTTREVNLQKTEWVISKIKENASEFEKKHSRKPSIACMGLAYKPDVDDLRESPALEIAERLHSLNLDITVDEPHIQSIKGLKLANVVDSDQTYDIYVFLVKHTKYKHFPTCENALTLDYCGLFDERGH